MVPDNVIKWTCPDDIWTASIGDVILVDISGYVIIADMESSILFVFNLKTLHNLTFRAINKNSMISIDNTPRQDLNNNIVNGLFEA